MIEEGAKRALSDLSTVAPWNPGTPSEIRVEYLNTTQPDKLRFRHGVERVDDRTIVSRADAWWEAWKQFYF
jgi:D-aminopeptidase